MHTCTLIIGDVESQMAPLTAYDGWCDWWGIGGRYTGRLMLKPGAEGKVFGDTMPPFEAIVVHAVSAALPETTITRPVAQRGDGVDQARLGDVENIHAEPGALVVGGVVHEPHEDECKARSEQMASLAKGAEDDRPMAEVMPRWVALLGGLLGAADPDELITVVDVHW